MALDDATKTLIDQLAPGNGKALHQSSPAEARLLGGLLASLAGLRRTCITLKTIASAMEEST